MSSATHSRSVSCSPGLVASISTTSCSSLSSPRVRNLPAKFNLTDMMSVGSVHSSSVAGQDGARTVLCDDVSLREEVGACCTDGSNSLQTGTGSDKYGQVHTHAFGSGLYLEIECRVIGVFNHSQVLCPDLDDMLILYTLISSQSKSVSSSDTHVNR